MVNLKISLIMYIGLIAFTNCKVKTSEMVLITSVNNLENKEYSQNISIWPEIIGLEEFHTGRIKKGFYDIDENGNVNILNNRDYPSKHILNFDKGDLIGTSNGEWGGELYFKNNDPTKNKSSLNGRGFTYSYEYIIYNKNVHEIFNYNNEIYVLTGLAHGGLNHGNLIKLKNRNGVLSIEFDIELDSEPQSYKIHNGIVYILTCYELITFDGKSINTLFVNKQDWRGWGNVYKASLFINEEIIGIGARDQIIIIKDNSIKKYR